LSSTDDGKTYEQTKTVSDDKVAGDNAVDLEYTDLVDDQSYNLEVVNDEDGSSYFVFTDACYEKLTNSR